MIFNEVINVLLIEDEDFDVRRVKNTIRPFEDKIRIVEVVSNGKAALDLLKQAYNKIEVIIMDFQIAGGIMGESLIRMIKEVDANLQIIVVTKMTINITDYNFANSLIRAGAYWYCTKYPGDIEEYIYQPTDFILSIFNAYEKNRLERESLKSREKLNKNVEDILFQRRLIGESPSIVKLRDDLKRYAQGDVNILIRGASGTGKELVAYNIHYRSPRKFENFVVINCGSLPGELVESELFGYEKGAFTGADKKKLGLFEVANNGTVFLDEVTELPLLTQVKLLRVIQEGEIEKIGRTEKIKVNVRIIAATNKNIEDEVKAKRFRADLYYRLNVVPIDVQDLKYRKEDIAVLLDHFLNNYAFQMSREKPVISKDAFDIFCNYSWPGNVRELKNVIQRLLFFEEEEINANMAKLSLGIVERFDEYSLSEGFFFSEEEDIQPLKQMEKIFREKYFSFVRKHSESDTDAASKLGLAPPNYYRMAKELGLK